MPSKSNQDIVREITQGNKPVTVPGVGPVQYVARLTRQQYERLEKMVGATRPIRGASPQDYGFLLGQQDVLRILREGFTDVQ